MNNGFELLAPVMGLVALIFAYLMAAKINKVDVGTKRMEEIATYIQEGSMAFMKREYKALAIFVVVLFVIIAIGLDPLTAVCFLIGAVFLR